MRNRMCQGKRLGVIGAIALTALLLVTACARPPAVEGKVVEFGSMFGLTGSGADMAPFALAGVLDYVRHFNEEGTIPGVTVKVVWRDSAGNADRYTSVWEEFITRGMPLLVSGEGSIARKAQTEQQKMPMLVTTTMSAGVASPTYWMYFLKPTETEAFCAAADYIKENWHEARPPRLALMLMDTIWSTEVKIPGAKYASDLGIEVLPIETIPFIPIDSTIQLLRLKNEGADFVFIHGLVGTSGPILRDAERLGLVDKITFCGNIDSLDVLTIKMAGPAAEGYFAPSPEARYSDTDIPGIQLMRDLQMKYHGKPEEHTPYITGFIAGGIACEAMRRAVENVGSENVDGTAIKEALDSFKGFDVYGLGTIDYTWDRRGSNKVAIYEVKGGEVVRITDWREAPILVPEE